MANDTRNVKIGVCRIIYDGVDLGLTKGGVEVEVATETYKVEVDQYGKSPINEIVMSRSCSVKVPLAETTLENLVATMPGATLVQNGGAKATGTITISTQPVANDTVTVGGVVYTFKASVVAATDVLIGASAAATAQNLRDTLANSTNPIVSQAVYTIATNVVTVTYGSFGTNGNTFTLAKSSAGITLSGATLAGGVNPTAAKVNVTNGVGIDLLQISKKLVLHPTALADNDKSQDFVIPRAGTSGGLQFAYKLDQERVYNTTFVAYPDPATGVLFILGNEAAT